MLRPQQAADCHREPRMVSSANVAVMRRELAARLAIPCVNPMSSDSVRQFPMSFLRERSASQSGHSTGPLGVFVRHAMSRRRVTYVDRPRWGR
jgi:hypothetical protein